MHYAFIELDEIFSRLLKSGLDSAVYRLMLEKFLPRDEVQTYLKEYSSLTRKDRPEVLKKAANYLKDKNLDKYKRHEWCDILCDHVVETASDVRKWFDYIFGHTDIEDRLYPLIKKYLRGQFKKVFETYNMKKESWPDFFALEESWGGKRLMAVDAKTRYSEYKRFLNQARVFMRYSDSVFLAVTPGFSVELGVKIKRSPAYGELLLKEDLKKDGIGLLVVDMTSKTVTQYLDSERSGMLDDNEKDKCLRKLSVM